MSGALLPLAERIRELQGKRDAAQADYVAAVRRLRLAERELDEVIDRQDELVEEQADA